MLALKSCEDVGGMVEGIDDLQLLDAFGPLQHGENGSLNDEVVWIEFQELLGRYTIEIFKILPFRFFHLFRIAIKKPLFILEVYQ